MREEMAKAEQEWKRFAWVSRSRCSFGVVGDLADTVPDVFARKLLARRSSSQRRLGVLFEETGERCSAIK